MIKGKSFLQCNLMRMKHARFHLSNMKYRYLVPNEIFFLEHSFSAHLYYKMMMKGSHFWQLIFPRGTIYLLKNNKVLFFSCAECNMGFIANSFSLVGVLALLLDATCIKMMMCSNKLWNIHNCQQRNWITTSQSSPNKAPKLLLLLSHLSLST